MGVQWGGGMVNVRTTVRRTCCFWAKTCAAHETPCTPCLLVYKWPFRVKGVTSHCYLLGCGSGRGHFWTYLARVRHRNTVALPCYDRRTDRLELEALSNSLTASEDRDLRAFTVWSPLTEKFKFRAGQAQHSSAAARPGCRGCPAAR